MNTKLPSIAPLDARKDRRLPSASSGRSSTTGPQNSSTVGTWQVPFLGLFLTLAGIIMIAPQTRAGELDSLDLEQATQIECGNLTFGGNKTSVCFADAFLKKMQGATNLNVATKYRPVRLDSAELFEVPFCILSGEGSFRFSDAERENLRDYVHRGGFILSSPGCSDSAFDGSLRKEIAAIFTEQKLEKIPMDHLIFRTVKPISKLTTKRGSQTLVEGLTIDGRLALIYSLDGLNDARNAKGCCCCGGNEIKEAADVNINILAYALLY